MYALPQQSLGGCARGPRAGARPRARPRLALPADPGARHAFERRPPPLPDRGGRFRHAGGIGIAPRRGGLPAVRSVGLVGAGRECRHNLNYWHFGDYLGIGAGAHGKLTHPSPAPSCGRSACAIRAVIWRPRARGPRRGHTARRRGRPRVRVLPQRAGGWSDGFRRRRFRTAHRPAVVIGRWIRRERRVARPASRGPAGSLGANPAGRRFLNDLQAVFLPDPTALAANTDRGGLALPTRIG